MPKIIDYQRVQASGTLTGVNVPQTGNAAQLLQMKGRAATKAGDVLNRAIERNAQIAAEKDIANARLKIQEDFEAFKSDPKLTAEGATGFTDNFDDHMMKIRDDLMTNAKTSSSRDLIDQQFANIRITNKGRAIDFETRQGQLYQTQNAVQTYEANANAIRSNPDWDTYYDVVDQNQSLVDALDIKDPSVRQKMLKDFNNGVTNSIANGFIDEIERNMDAGQAQQFLDDFKEEGVWTSSMNEQDYTRTLARATRAAASIKDHNKTINDYNIRDWMKGASDGQNLGEKQNIVDLAMQTYEGDRLKIALKEIDSAHLSGVVGTSVKGASQADLIQMEKDVAAGKGELFNYGGAALVESVFYERLRQHRKNLSERPVDYIHETNEMASQAYQAFQNKGDVQSALDYLAVMESESVRMGIHPSNVKLIPTGEIAGLKQLFSDLGQNADSQDQLLTKLNSYSKFGPKVNSAIRRQLISDEVITGVTSVAAMLPEADRTSALKLLEANKEGADILLERSGSVEKKRDIRESVRSELSDFTSALSGDFMGSEYADNMTESATLLAAKYMSEGDSRKDAIRKASKLFTSKYHYIDTDNDEYLAPATLDKTSIINGLDYVKKNMSQFAELNAFQSMYIDNQQMVADEAMRRLQNDGAWRTSANGKGVTLTTSNGNAVWSVNNEGRMEPVTIEFEDLIQYGTWSDGEAPRQEPPGMAGPGAQ